MKQNVLQLYQFLYVYIIAILLFILYTIYPIFKIVTKFIFLYHVLLLKTRYFKISNNKKKSSIILNYNRRFTSTSSLLKKRINISRMFHICYLCSFILFLCSSTISYDKSVGRIFFVQDFVYARIYVCMYIDIVFLSQKNEKR